MRLGKIINEIGIFGNEKKWDDKEFFIAHLLTHDTEKQHITAYLSRWRDLDILCGKRISDEQLMTFIKETIIGLHPELVHSKVKLRYSSNGSYHDDFIIKIIVL